MLLPATGPRAVEAVEHGLSSAVTPGLCHSSAVTDALDLSFLKERALNTISNSKFFRQGSITYSKVSEPFCDVQIGVEILLPKPPED